MTTVGTATVNVDVPPPQRQEENWHASSTRNGLTVFFVSGVFMSFLGAILPVWGYHLRDNHVEVGRYFLALGAGLLAAHPLGQSLLARKRDTRFPVVLGCAMASFSMIWLAVSSPPVGWGWRMAGVGLVGVSAGLLNASGFQSLSRMFEHDRASTVNMAGTLFGLGCFATALAVWTAFYTYTASSLLLLFSVGPAFAAGLYRKASFPAPAPHTERPVGEVLRELRSPGAVIFSLLLFFQFANEWTVAGWLPIFLVQRVGVSPERAILLLAVFWMALLLGRVAAQGILPRVGHGKLLIASAALALFGCTILVATNNYFGAWAGTLMAGAGFSTVYPLMVERIAHRFPDYHPGFYNGLLSFGISGGLLAPWLIGYPSNWWGIAVVMWAPAIGMVMVFLLLLLLWMEARLSGTP